MKLREALSRTTTGRKYVPDSTGRRRPEAQSRRLFPGLPVHLHPHSSLLSTAAPSTAAFYELHTYSRELPNLGRAGNPFLPMMSGVGVTLWKCLSLPFVSWF